MRKILIPHRTKIDEEAKNLQENFEKEYENFNGILLAFLKEKVNPLARRYCHYGRWNAEIFGLDNSRVPFGIMAVDGKIIFHYPWDDDPPGGGPGPIPIIKSWDDFYVFQNEFPQYVKDFLEDYEKKKKK